jgi:hypothetical protein
MKERMKTGMTLRRIAETAMNLSAGPPGISLKSPGFAAESNASSRRLAVMQGKPLEANIPARTDLAFPR